MRAVFQRIWRCQACALGAFGIFFAVAIVACFLADLRNRYHSAIIGAEQNALSFAKVLAEHTARTFEAVDHTLREAEVIRQHRLAERPAILQGVNEALRLLRQSSPVLIAIGTNAKSGKRYCRNGSCTSSECSA